MKTSVKFISMLGFILSLSNYAQAQHEGHTQSGEKKATEEKSTGHEGHDMHGMHGMHGKGDMKEKCHSNPEMEGCKAMMKEKKATKKKEK